MEINRVKALTDQYAAVSAIANRVCLALTDEQISKLELPEGVLTDLKAWQEEQSKLTSGKVAA